MLREPPPVVLAVATHEGALDFEIHAFVDSFDKRLRAQHAINLDVARALREQGI